MRSSEKIDKIYEKINTMPLSAILPMVVDIALECNDYQGFCILTYWNSPMGEGTSLAQRQEIERILLKVGVPSEDVLQIEKESFLQYMNMRKVEGDKVNVWCVKEIEDYFKRCDDTIKASEVPKELHPVDLYFRSQTAKKIKLTVIHNRQDIEKQYAILQNYIVSKLAYYRQVSIVEERKEDLKRGMKDSKDVFIIHGHSEAKLLELEKLLRDEFRLNPIILKNKPDGGLTIIEKFEKFAQNCSYAFALFTPDDIVSSGDQQYFQARPNVIFELGWFYANLGRNRVCILEQASDKSKIFSDLQGVMRVQFNNDISECVIKIKRELQDVGII